MIAPFWLYHNLVVTSQIPCHPEPPENPTARHILSLPKILQSPLPPKRRISTTTSETLGPLHVPRRVVAGRALIGMVTLVFPEVEEILR